LLAPPEVELPLLGLLPMVEELELGLEELDEPPMLPLEDEPEPMLLEEPVPVLPEVAPLAPCSFF
jgi:hypothetical protein